MKTTMAYDIIYVKEQKCIFFQLWLNDAGNCHAADDREVFPCDTFCLRLWVIRKTNNIISQKIVWSRLSEYTKINLEEGLLHIKYGFHGCRYRRMGKFEEAKGHRWRGDKKFQQYFARYILFLPLSYPKWTFDWIWPRQCHLHWYLKVGRKKW